jgi:hypothetical protein
MAESDRMSWIDRAIREAQERGLFDGLEGEGKPIDWEDESLIDDEWLMAFRIMREHGFAPEWIEMHKEISQQLAGARDAVLRACSAPAKPSGVTLTTNGVVRGLFSPKQSMN